MSKASWAGARIVLAQISEESLAIFQIIQQLFTPPNSTATAAEIAQHVQGLLEEVLDNNNNNTESAKLFHEDVSAVLLYFSCFLGNLSNYQSFGDTKFIPACEPASFQAVLEKIQSILEARGYSQTGLELHYIHNVIKSLYTPSLTLYAHYTHVQTSTYE